MRYRHYARDSVGTLTAGSRPSTDGTLARVCFPNRRHAGRAAAETSSAMRLGRRLYLPSEAVDHCVTYSTVTYLG